MKKGFTLVEMSIVIVIIGILMALVVKGKELIETARFTREWNVLRNIGLALELYSSANNDHLQLTKSGAYTLLDVRKIMNYMDMKEDDFKSIVFENTYYPPMLLTVTSRGDFFYNDPNKNDLDYYKVKVENRRGVAGAKSAKTLYFSSLRDTQFVPVYVLCRLEYAFDDRNFFDGKLRFFAENYGNFKDISDDCAIYDDKKNYPDQDFGLSFYY